MSFAPQVIADDSGRWTGNRLRFATRAEAQSSAWDLEARWTLVTATRVVESDDPVNMRWLPGAGRGPGRLREVEGQSS
jgi:hypothetical protein